LVCNYIPLNHIFDNILGLKTIRKKDIMGKLFSPF